MLSWTSVIAKVLACSRGLGRWGWSHACRKSRGEISLPPKFGLLSTNMSLTELDNHWSEPCEIWYIYRTFVSKSFSSPEALMRTAWTPAFAISHEASRLFRLLQGQLLPQLASILSQPLSQPLFATFSQGNYAPDWAQKHCFTHCLPPKLALKQAVNWAQKLFHMVTMLRIELTTFNIRHLLPQLTQQIHKHQATALVISWASQSLASDHLSFQSLASDLEYINHLLFHRCYVSHTTLTRFISQASKPGQGCFLSDTQETTHTMILRYFQYVHVSWLSLCPICHSILLGLGLS
jgi:hypothetical protein